jgi:hypothetical protein
MPQPCQIGPIAGVEVVREVPGHSSDFIQMIFKSVPFFRGFPFSGMGVEFVFHLSSFGAKFLTIS